MAGSVEPDAGRDETDAGRDETDPGIHQADRRDEAPWREQRAAPEFREGSPSAAHRHGNRRRGVARRRPRRLAHHPAAHALRGVDRSPPSDARGGLDCHRAPRIGGVGRRPSPPTVGRASAAAAARRHSRRGCDAGDAPARGARGCSHQGKAGQGRNEQVRQHALTAPAVWRSFFACGASRSTSWARRPTRSAPPSRPMGRRSGDSLYARRPEVPIRAARQSVLVVAGAWPPRCRRGGASTSTSSSPFPDAANFNLS